MIKQQIWIAGVLTATMMVTACSDDKESGAAVTEQAAMQAVATKPDLLKYVPSDTPYVFASSKAFPRELMEKMLKNSNQELQHFVDAYNEVLEAEKVTAADADALEPAVSVDLSVDSKFEDLVAAVLIEIEGKLTPDGLESLGFSMQARSVVYGLGILPVMRTEVKDPALVEAFIARIETRSGMKAISKTVNDQSYRWFDLDNLVAVMALREKHLIVALLPAGAEAETLPLVLGDTLPKQSLADTDTFETLYEDYGFSGFGDGYIDMVKITEFMMGEGDAESMMIRQALEINTEEITPACENLVKSQVQSWPRLVVGFPEVTANRYTMRGVIETSAGVAGWIKKLAAPVPGLGESNKSLLSFGLALNLPELRDAMKAGLQTILADGKGCEWVDEAELTTSMQTVDLMFNPMIAGIRGLYLKIDQLELDAETMMPSTIDAKLLLAVDDPKGIFAMMGMLNHKFTQMQIPSDGTPVELPMDEVAPGVPPTFVAIKDKILGFSVGIGSEKTLPDFLVGELVSPSPMLSVGYDVALLAKAAEPVIDVVKQSMEGNQDDGSQTALEAMDALQSSGDVYGQVSVQITASDRGLVMDQVINLR